jgi:hypothetical protein
MHPNIVCIRQIDSRILVFCGNRLKILWLFDSRFFGSPRQINELSDSLLIGPDTFREISRRVANGPELAAHAAGV